MNDMERLAIEMTNLLPRHVAEEWLDKIQRAKADDLIRDNRLAAGKPRRYVTIGGMNYAISKIESYSYDRTSKMFSLTICGKDKDWFIDDAQEADAIISTIEAYE